MFVFDDVPFQLVDLPPVSAEYMESWMPNALQPALAALLVVDLAAAGCVDNVTAIREKLGAKRISLIPAWPGSFENVALDIEGDAAADLTDTADRGDDDGEEDDDPFRLHVPTLLIAAKSDLDWDPEEIGILEELVGVRYPAISVSVKTGHGIDKIGRALFDGLGIVRVYTKIPGRPADSDRPFTVFKGETVLDVARLVHRELAVTLKFARIWGSAKFDGQQVGKDHVVSDGDIVELHG